ncbi:MAG: agmatine deiminase family protein [Flavobacteriales bacterium]
MRTILATLALGAFLVANAQQQGLPHKLAPEELHLIPAYRDSRASLQRSIQGPPEFPVRTMAEWEEVKSLVITWTGFPSILKQIVRYAKEECEVIIVCDNPAAVSQVLNNSSAGGPLDDLSNITFLQAGFNSIWVRDYGAETIYRNEVDSLLLLDWIYNRPRPLDDVLPDAIASLKNIPIYGTTQAPYDLVHTGGNFMCDGAGTAFSSNLVLEENGPQGGFNQTVKSAAQVDTLMSEWMGIDLGRYIKMNTLPYDAIHHIDMHMKLLDEETLLVGEFPQGVSDGPQLEQNLQGIMNGYDNVFGDPYDVVRIPMPPSTSGGYAPSASYRTYANNVFINKTVLVPTYRTEYDTTGLRILRESLPGYRVVGIDCDDGGSNIIAQSGAIHCITKAIGVEDPLLIRHKKLRDTYETVTPYTVSAYIRHRSGIASAELYWTTDTAQGFIAVPMIAGADNDWTAAIPAQSASSVIFYYIRAVAENGKVQVRPMVAPEGWWRFKVLDLGTAVADPDGPLITEVFPNPTQGVLVVTLERFRNEPVRVALYDATGRQARVLHDGPMFTDGKLILDISSLAPGAYALVATSQLGSSTMRVLKQ